MEGLGTGRRSEQRGLKIRWGDMSVCSGRRPKMLHVLFSDDTHNQLMKMQEAKVLHATFSILFSCPSQSEGQAQNRIPVCAYAIKVLADAIPFAFLQLL